MEGLFIAKILEMLAGVLPARNLGWVFPDEVTAALLLEPVARPGAKPVARPGAKPVARPGAKPVARSGTLETVQAEDSQPFNLVFSYRPPTPALFVTRERLSGGPRNAFQRALESRVKGNLERAQQLKLDRVVLLEFGESRGFIDAPAVRLVFELTGRNANLLMLEAADTSFEGRILAAAREITGTRNRFRQVRLGGMYTPPPPYDKRDPRQQEGLEAVLNGVPITVWHTRIDGLGPVLAREVAFRSGLDPDQPLTGSHLERAIQALQDVIQNPSLSSTNRNDDTSSSNPDASLSDQARTRSRDEKLSGLRKALREPLEKRLRLLERQLEDVETARTDAIAALEQREWADILLAFSRDVPVGVSSVRLPNLYGAGEIEINLDPALDAVQNAHRYYTRARRREEILMRLEEREPQLRESRTELKALLERVANASEAELEQMMAATIERESRPAVGTRYRTRNDFEVLVGRNSRENEFLTHRLAHSLDWWFHVQGFPGSHTILRCQGREVPFPDILEAAAIAAYHSKARGERNVAVDYTTVKSVWRPRGSKAGAVYFSGQKTVFVDALLPAEPV
jgi:predicted ribosome quality control (RQC) complex YloA/Tae2 family protein